ACWRVLHAIAERAREYSASLPDQVIEDDRSTDKAQRPNLLLQRGIGCSTAAHIYATALRSAVPCATHTSGWKTSISSVGRAKTIGTTAALSTPSLAWRKPLQPRRGSWKEIVMRRCDHRG